MIIDEKSSEFEIQKFGFKRVWISHDKMKGYNACYNVIYADKKICPPAGEILGIPLNEIWISDKFTEYEQFILFHELQEIKYRANGLTKEEAHLKTLNDEINLWKHNPKWIKMNKELGIGREHL